MIRWISSNWHIFSDQLNAQDHNAQVDLSSLLQADLTLAALWATTFAFVLVLVIIPPKVLASSQASPSSTEEWETVHIIGKFLYSDPPKPDQIFKVHYRAVNGTVQSVHANEGFAATVSSDGESGLLEIMFPRNYPYTNEQISDGRNVVIFMNDETPHNADQRITVSDCFFVFSIPFTGNGDEVELGWSKLLWTAPHHGDQVPESCIPQTIAGLAPAQQELQMCDELDIALESCNKVEIFKRISIIEEQKTFDEQQNQINTSVYLIDVGAAIAGVFAFLTLRKRN